MKNSGVFRPFSGYEIGTFICGSKVHLLYFTQCFYMPLSKVPDCVIQHKLVYDTNHLNNSGVKYIVS